MEAPQIAARRIRLRPLREEDFDAFAEMVGEGDTMRFLRHGIGLTRDEARELFDEFLGEWNDHEYGHWAIEDRRDGEFLGYVGILPYDQKVGEIEFLINASRWRRGFATEAARAAMLYALDTLAFIRVVGAVHPANRAGQRVMEKVGMSHREDIQDGHGLKMWVYAITAMERRMLRTR
jgi:RimJ/RimL family protein N-acetyltransferase